MSNRPEQDNGVVSGVYGAPVQNTFTPPIPPSYSDGSVQTYGAPAPNNFSQPVNEQIVPPAPVIPPAPVVPPAPIAEPMPVTPPVQEPQYTAPAPESVAPPAPEPQHTAPAPEPQYAPPAPQPQYTAPAPQPQYTEPAPKPIKEKKNGGNKKLLIIGAVAVVVILAIVLLVVGSGSKGGVNDLFAGVYNATSCEVSGMELGAEGEWMELKANGKAEVFILGSNFTGKWELQDDGTFVFVQAGTEYLGTLKGNVLTVDYAGMVYTFCKEGTQMPEAEEAPEAADKDVIPEKKPEAEKAPEAAPVVSAYDWWEGDWYGWWVVYSAYGSYEEYTDSAWDVCARIGVDGETGTVAIWDNGRSADNMLAEAEISFRSGLTENGCFVSESGYFLDDALEHADWNVDAGVGFAKDFEHMICIEGVYVDPEDEDSTIDYYIFLRPWGMDWEDVRNADNSENLYLDMMPLQYDSWYVPQMNAGSPMPDSFDAAGGSASSGATGEMASHTWDNFRVDIVGAEHFTDSEDKDAIRIYYDFTNLSDESFTAYGELGIEVTQDEYEQQDAYAYFEDDVPEYGNDSKMVRPGVTVRCVAEYSMKPTGGPVVVKIWDYWDEAYELTFELDPQNLPGRPGDWALAPVADPDWLGDVPTEGVYCDDYYMSIDSAEIIDGYDGQALRVYYTFTNNSDEATTFWTISYCRAYQDGLELSYSYPNEYVEADENTGVEVAPGESIVAANVFELRSNSPVEVELYDIWTEDVLGVIFLLE